MQCIPTYFFCIFVSLDIFPLDSVEKLNIHEHISMLTTVQTHIFRSHTCFLPGNRRVQALRVVLCVAARQLEAIARVEVLSANDAHIIMFKCAL